MCVYDQGSIEEPILFYYKSLLLLVFIILSLNIKINMSLLKKNRIKIRKRPINGILA